MRGAKLKSVHCAKNLGVEIAPNLKFLYKYCIDAVYLANTMVSFLDINMMDK